MKTCPQVFQVSVFEPVLLKKKRKKKRNIYVREQLEASACIVDFFLLGEAALVYY